VVLSAFLSGLGSATLPLVIFSRARLGLNPSVNAIATVVVIIAIGVAIANIMIARQERRRASEPAAARRYR
jgi:putrescine transport system permease protein